MIQKKRQRQTHDFEYVKRSCGYTIKTLTRSCGYTITKESRNLNGPWIIELFFLIVWDVYVGMNIIPGASASYMPFSEVISTFKRSLEPQQAAAYHFHKPLLCQCKQLNYRSTRTPLPGIYLSLKSHLHSTMLFQLMVTYSSRSGLDCSW